MLDQRPLSGAEIDTLVALVERGPLESGDIPSKAGRSDLVGRGYAAFIVVKGEITGVCAATVAGAEAYKRQFGTSMDIPGDKPSLSEVIANRQALSGINRAFYRPKGN